MYHAKVDLKDRICVECLNNRPPPGLLLGRLSKWGRQPTFWYAFKIATSRHMLTVLGSNLNATDSWNPPSLGEPGKWLGAVLTLFARAQQSASTVT